MKYVDYEDTYKIYENGLIKKVRAFKDPTKQVPKRQIRQYDGHEVAILYVKGSSLNKRVDELVAESFEIDKPKGHNFLVHIDNNKLNHQVENLKWVNIFEYLSETHGSKWKRIKDVEADGKFYISKDGRVWGSKTESLLKVQATDGSSPTISLGKHRKRYLIKALLKESFPEGNDMPKVEDEKVAAVEADLPEYAVVSTDFKKLLITPDGKVYDTKAKSYLAQTATPDGYFTVSYNGSNHRVHRLVASAYIPKREDRDLVNHKDRNRKHNHFTNLEWVTHSENMKHIYTQGQTGKKQVRRINVEQMTYKIFPGVKEAAKLHSVNSGSITGACQRKVKAAGFRWEYVGEKSEFEELKEEEDTEEEKSDSE